MALNQEMNTQPALSALPILVAGGTAGESEALVALLASYGHSAVTAVNDVTQVLPALTGATYRLVVLGLTTQAGAGLHTLRSIRSQFSVAGLPIVVASSATEPEARKAALQAGANDYLSGYVDSDEWWLRTGTLLGMSDQYHTAHMEKEQLRAELQTRSSQLGMLIENGLLMAQTHDRTRLLRHTLFEALLKLEWVKISQFFAEVESRIVKRGVFAGFGDQ